MNELEEAIRFISAVKATDPTADKEKIQAFFVSRFSPLRKRGLFIGRGYAIRFSEVHGTSFSNTVLSLSALRGVDYQPLMVCIVGPASVKFMLANSTFLKKVSHSSHHLRVDNVRGSFNGTDILSDHCGVKNRPENFERLFAIHSAFTWSENLERLVEATTAIVGRDLRFQPTEAQRVIILAAPERAAAALSSAQFFAIEAELRAIVYKNEQEIVRAAAVDNVNLRGNRIERMVTGGRNVHDLGDLRRDFDDGQLVVDVKTKLSGKVSAPKAYNIDKLLAFLAHEGSVFAFLVLAIDVSAGSITTRLVSIFDQVIMEATAVQHHWAGRVSRGVAQLSGRFDRVLTSGYIPRLDIAKARVFLADLLAR